MKQGSSPHASGGRAERDALRGWRVAGLVATAAIIAAIPLHLAVRRARGPARSPPSASRYVGSQRCKECHAKEYDAWKGSHHAQAMQVARDGTVLGDFGGISLRVAGKTWRFFRRGEKFMAHAEGPDGAMRDFEVAYTFGVDPLQQYLIPFPGGRLQALSVAWDTRAKRWFHVRPGSPAPPGDWLHWTRPGQSWNAMCADCHSTDLRKGYDPEQDSYRTTWSELSVGCEACHGPGSRHVEWGAQPPMGRPAAENAGLAVRTSGLSGPELANRCAPCHSRRAQVADQGVPGGELLDHYVPVLLEEGTFHPDGQILEEDYEWHAFTQSKMYANGVRCADCHDVHSGRRHQEGNALCTRCHRADTYDTALHHFHKPTWKGKPSAAVLCVSCHMPARSYMVVHLRRDHSLRVPRPDLTAAIGVPNACSACHADRSLAWIQGRFEAWWGKGRKPSYGTVLAAGRRRAPDAEVGLVELAQDPTRPAIVRATAVDLLASTPSPTARLAMEKALSDPEPLVRATAALRVPAADASTLVRLLGGLLRDPVRWVRDQAAARLAGVPAQLLPDGQRAARAAALDEYVAAQRYMADLPSGPFHLGNLFTALGRPADAEREYRRSLRIDDRYFPAMVNLAMLVAGQGRLGEAEGLLRGASALQPEDAGISFDLGLLMAEAGDLPGAARTLETLLRTHPDDGDASLLLEDVYTRLGRAADAQALRRGPRAKRPPGQAEPRP